MQWFITFSRFFGPRGEESPWNDQQYKITGGLKPVLQEGTSRQRSGKGAIRKLFPLQKPRWEKTK